MEQKQNASATPAGALAIIAIIFLFSGATGLIYEVVWTRQLTTFFGSSLYGVATVLSAFMGGLALGSFLIGKRADGMKHPLVVYGLLEIGIGIAALIFPFVLKATQPIIGSVYATGGDNNFLVYSLVRFVIVFALLLVPTTLMGATLPVMSKAVTPSLKVLGKRVGGLYAINTAGAVLGVFAAGFFLIESLGIFRTTLVAVGVDFIIGGICYMMGRTMFVVKDGIAQVESNAAAEAAPSEESAVSPGILRLILATYLLSGFVALAYQVCWTRAMIFSFDTLKSTTYSFSGMLLIFLLGLAIGSAVMQAIVDRQNNLVRLYALIQTGIGIGGGLSYFLMIKILPALNELTPDGDLIYWNAVGNVLIKTAITIGLPTLLMGMAFPVVTKIVVGSVKNLGIDVARVYSLNTVGAILGSFASGFVLIPLFGISGTLALLVMVNLLLAALLFFVNPGEVKGKRMAYATACVLVALFVPSRMAFSHLKLQRIQENEKIVHYEEGAMATISVVENNSGDRMIYVDDVGVAGTDKIMLTDQKSLAHVPMMLLGGKATRVLSVGFGSGGASWSYTLYPGVEQIRTIEIAPEVLRAAPSLTDSNHGIIVDNATLEKAKAANAKFIKGFRHPISDYVYTAAPGFKTFDPRFEVLLDDARSYLRFTDKKFDVIATDCTDLRYKSNANLYDLEYFKLCREAITDDGLVVVWMPLGGLSDNAFRCALKTFQDVFPEMSVWYFTNQPTHYCLLIATKGPLKINYDDVVDATAMPEVVSDLEEIGLRDPDKLISSFVVDERSLAELLKPYPLNTEDHPIIEFESPRYGYNSQPLHDNQMHLYEVQDPVSAVVVGESDATADRLWRLQEANVIVFEGHSAYRLYDFKKACELYMKALAIVPNDSSIKGLLDFEELIRHFETSKRHSTLNTLVIGQGLAEVYYMQGRLEQAVTFAHEAATLVNPTEPPEQISDGARRSIFGIYAVLAKSYAQRGVPDRVKKYLDEAARYSVDPEETEKLKAEVREAEAKAS